MRESQTAALQYISILDDAASAFSTIWTSPVVTLEHSTVYLLESLNQQLMQLQQVFPYSF